jgi:hypothetical protein
MEELIKDGNTLQYHVQTNTIDEINSGTLVKFWYLSLEKNEPRGLNMVPMVNVGGVGQILNTILQKDGSILDFIRTDNAHFEKLDARIHQGFTLG